MAKNASNVAPVVSAAELWRSKDDLKALLAGDLAKLEEAFAAAGAPWILGRRVP
jgi:hypothetical protein